MRLVISSPAAMASSFAVCRLHMTGRGSLLKCFKKVESLTKRNIVSNVVAAQGEAVHKEETGEKDGPQSMQTLLLKRLEQAERSVLINCFSKTDEKKLVKYLSSHGEIKKHFFYESYGIYAVVEYTNRESVSSLLEEAAFPSINHEFIVPFKSRLLSLRNLGSTDTTGKQLDKLCKPQTTVPINELIQRLSREESIDQQVTSLTKAYQLTDENVRLRFLVCSLLKDIAVAYFPECTIKPFGSSVNGFGKLGCDLDMFLDLDSIVGKKMPVSGLCLEYQTKRENSERVVTQNILSVIGECVDQFGPGCVGVQKILNARCPLVRFAHQPSGFQCDLTANNRVAMKSTELLYLYGELDPRVRHLVFTVRCWARAHAITSSISGAWITNFSLTVMVLFFLQKRSPPIIPTLDHLRDLAGPTDKCVIESNDCTFVTDFRKIQLQNNTETLETLLCEFFEFYASFSFSKMSISIRKGKEQNKPEITPLYIQNPFETSLNVSKNVNVPRLNRFVALCQESLWLLQQDEIRTPGGTNAASPWGLASLLLPSGVAGVKSSKKRKREPASDRIKGLLESLKNNQQKKS